MATEEPTHAEGKGGKERISGMQNTAAWLNSFPPFFFRSFESLCFQFLLFVFVSFLPLRSQGLFRGFAGRQIHLGDLLNDTVIVSNQDIYAVVKNQLHFLEKSII